MLNDPIAAKTMSETLRKTTSPRPWLPLLSALLQLAEGKGELVRHGERPWASATFSGSRHTVLLCFAGIEAAKAAERFIAALPDHEFAIPRHLVADAAISEVRHAALPHPLVDVEVEILVLDEV